jgi:hypothetical protein
MIAVGEGALVEHHRIALRDRSGNGALSAPDYSLSRLFTPAMIFFAKVS